MRSRLLASAAAAALVVVVIPKPAAAAPSHAPCGASVTGTASADLVRIDALDARALGVLHASALGLRIASARAGVTTSRATASARAIDPLSASVAAQQAPPARPDTRVQSRAVDLGVASVGTGDLRAQAACPSASASATMLDATVLPGKGGLSVLRVPGNVNSGASIGGYGTVSARVGLTDVRVFDGTAGRLAVKVLTEPTLTVAGGTVYYTSPVLEVTLPGGTVHRLDSPGRHIDLAVSGSGTVSASGPARSVNESLPGNPLTAIIGSTPAAGHVVVLRLSVGTVTRHGVRGADAASLRVQLLDSGVPLLDLGVGVLSADTSAPTATGAGSGSGGGTLPLTGVNVGWIVGIGLLVAIAGRFLLVVSRKRSAEL